MPLFIGRIHINSFESKYIFSDLKFNDKLYLGDYPIEIKDQNIQPTIDRIKIKKYDKKSGCGTEPQPHLFSITSNYASDTRLPPSQNRRTGRGHHGESR